MNARHLRGALLIGTALGLGCLRGGVEPLPPPSRDRPNILLIVADDLGYSDLGAYGSEIRTPNLDALARRGLLATDFYVAPRGAPTRAMLMTGMDNHHAGFGAPPANMPLHENGHPGEEGSLCNACPTLASRLLDAGYHTAMAGKWEIGESAEDLPYQRGFERSFVLHDGAASYWSDMRSAVPGRERARYTQDGRPVDSLPDDYFSTRFFTDFVIESIDANHADGRPFFAYLSYQAPHGPFAVTDEWRDRASGRYDVGFDRIRGARLLRMKQRRLVRQEVVPYPGIPTVPTWRELDPETRRSQARKMELYAAMVENLDHHVGRVVAHLRELGELQDTLIVFLSDNGPEPGNRGPVGMDLRNREWYAQQFPITEMAEWGRPGTFVEYGPAWAQVSSVPFRLFKGTQAEGGIRSPLILSGPGIENPGRRTRALLHVTDLVPTLLEVAGVDADGTEALYGRSFAGVLANHFRDRHGPHEWIGAAYGDGRLVRAGEWKLVRMEPPFGTGHWRLFRLSRDPSELFDESKRRADERKELEGLWEQYAERMGISLDAIEGESASNPP